MLRRAARVLPCFFACVLAASALSACSSQSASPKGTAVRVTVKDFRIKLSRTHVRAGDLRLVVHNRGPDTHEVLIAGTSAALPMREDNITVDEDALEPVTVDEVEAERPGEVEVLGVKLRPGSYVLFCNMAGHYLGGMRARLVVS